MARSTIPFYFGGTGLLIIVGVCMQTVAQIGDILSQQYDGMDRQSQGVVEEESLQLSD